MTTTRGNSTIRGSQQSMINKKQISDALALSCVEYYFLPWISQYYPVEKLYVQSFVSLKQLFDDFSRDCQYETYRRIPRIQDTSEGYGITKHTFVNATMRQAAEIIDGQGKDDLCLIRVNDAFLGEYKRKPWREDHYICVDGALNWVNEYPLSDGLLTFEKFLQIYDGTVCLFCLKNIRVEPKNNVSELFCGQDFGHIETDIGSDKFEEALGILRVSRKRLEKMYAGQAAVRDLLHTENLFLDKLYFSARLQRVRKRGDERELYGAFNRIIAMEQSIAEVLK